MLKDANDKSSGVHHHHQHQAHSMHQGKVSPAKLEAAKSIESSTQSNLTIYTCPMHPEVRQNGPGHCPICGMALEPLLPSTETKSPRVRERHALIGHVAF